MIVLPFAVSSHPSEKIHEATVVCVAPCIMPIPMSMVKTVITPRKIVDDLFMISYLVVFG